MDLLLFGSGILIGFVLALPAAMWLVEWLFIGELDADDDEEGHDPGPAA